MGRSAACAPATAVRPAADPRRRLLASFILTSKVSRPLRDRFALEGSSFPLFNTLTDAGVAQFGDPPCPPDTRDEASAVIYQAESGPGAVEACCSGTYV